MRGRLRSSYAPRALSDRPSRAHRRGRSAPPVVDATAVYRTVAHLRMNWNVADGPRDKRAVLIQMMIDFCRRDSTEPGQVYLLKRLLFVPVAPKWHGDAGGPRGWMALIAEALRFVCGCGATAESHSDLRGILYPNRQLSDRGDELLQLFQRKQLPRPVWHILTDIDDTIFAHPDWASVAGCDRSWDAHEPYPGIVQQEILRSASSDVSLFDGPFGDAVDLQRRASTRSGHTPSVDAVGHRLWLHARL